MENILALFQEGIQRYYGTDLYTQFPPAKTAVCVPSLSVSSVRALLQQSEHSTVHCWSADTAIDCCSGCVQVLKTRPTQAAALSLTSTSLPPTRTSP